MPGPGRKSAARNAPHQRERAEALDESIKPDARAPLRAIVGRGFIFFASSVYRETRWFPRVSFHSKVLPVSQARWQRRLRFQQSPEMCRNVAESPVLRERIWLLLPPFAPPSRNDLRY